MLNKIKEIKFSLYSRSYPEARKKGRGPSQQLSAWATQLHRNVAVVASRWRLGPTRDSNPRPYALIVTP